MIVGAVTICHTQYTWDRSTCVFLFKRTTLQVFVTYLIGTLYVHPLWFYKHQHDNWVHSKLFVACQRWWFQWRFWFVPSVLGYMWEEEEIQNKKIHSWIKIDQLMSLALFFAQHVLNASTFIFRSLRLCVGILLWFDMCWRYGVVRLGWCGILTQAEALVPQPT